MQIEKKPRRKSAMVRTASTAKTTEASTGPRLEGDVMRFCADDGGEVLIVGSRGGCVSVSGFRLKALILYPTDQTVPSLWVFFREAGDSAVGFIREVYEIIRGCFWGVNIYGFG